MNLIGRMADCFPSLPDTGLVLADHIACAMYPVHEPTTGIQSLKLQKDLSSTGLKA